MSESRRDKLLVIAALGAVYIVWGSTYFAMRVALTFLPPFLMAGPRFLVAGLLLGGVLRARGAAAPTRRQWLGASAVGVLLLVGGNGLVAIAQRTVDSGVAATVVATMPLWTAAIGAAWGDRPTRREVLGLIGGFAGVAALHRGGDLSFDHLDSIVLLLAPISWALGSLLSRRIELPSGLMATSAQMISGGVVMSTIALLREDRPVAAPSLSAIVALLYLVFIGSLVAFSAYGFLLRKTRPAIATSYAYVNPLVALALGSMLGGERFTLGKLIACVLTIAGVLVASTGPRR